HEREAERAPQAERRPARLGVEARRGAVRGDVADERRVLPLEGELDDLPREALLLGGELDVVEVAPAHRLQLTALLDEEEEPALEAGEVDHGVEDRVEEPVEVELARDRLREEVEAEEPVLEEA